MAPSSKSQPRQDRITKMPKLPANAKIAKRPLMRPAIASPYAGAAAEKVVYVSHKMPFMAGVRRVQSLQKQIDKRAMQSLMDTRRRKETTGSKAAPSEASEPVVIKATGKAIAKALQMAHFFQKQAEYRIQISTSTLDAIDDIELDDAPPAEDSASPAQDPEDVPEARIRAMSCVEIQIWQI